MKRIVTALMVLGMAGWAQAAYIQGGAGIHTVSDNSEAGPSTELRFGTNHGLLDVSVGYDRSFLKVGGANLWPGNLDLHTLGVEGYLALPIESVLKVKVGGGVGYTVPNLDSKNTERLDNNLSGSFGGKLEYPINNHVTVGVKAKYFMFHTDSHRTTMLTEQDVIYQRIHGHKVPIGVVETETPVYSDNSVNFNAVSVMVGVEYRF